ncbi:hypothetical protein KKA03_07010 [archaeon]|nr:hypothetical protein [archaeon]
MRNHIPLLSALLLMMVACDGGVPYGPPDGADPYVELQLSVRTMGDVNGAWELWIGVPRSNAVEDFAGSDSRLRLAAVDGDDFLVVGANTVMNETWTVRLEGFPYHGLLLVAEPSDHQIVGLKGSGVSAVWYELRVSGEDDDQYCSPQDETSGGVSVDSSTSKVAHTGGGLLCH